MVLKMMATLLTGFFKLHKWIIIISILKKSLLNKFINSFLQGL